MRSETILVVEDDPAVLDVLKEMLETAGSSSTTRMVSDLIS